MGRPLKTVFIISAVFNLVGAVILFFGTGLLNGLIETGGGTDYIWHLLGACSFALAVLSFCTIWVREQYAVLIILLTLLLFNLLTGVISIFTVLGGASLSVIGNTVMHGLLFIMFTVTGVQVLRKGLG